MPFVEDIRTLILCFQMAISSEKGRELCVESVTEPRNYHDSLCMTYDIIVDGKLYVVTFDIANGSYIVTSCGGDKAIVDKIESLIGT